MSAGMKETQAEQQPGITSPERMNAGWICVECANANTGEWMRWLIVKAECHHNIEEVINHTHQTDKQLVQAICEHNLGGYTKHH